MGCVQGSGPGSDPGTKCLAAKRARGGDLGEPGGSPSKRAALLVRLGVRVRVLALVLIGRHDVDDEDDLAA
jgi:hypothetical protein